LKKFCALCMSKLNFNFNNLFLKISLQEKIIFARHLSIMVKAGMPILDAIKMLQKQTKSKSLRKILDHVVDDVSNGQFMAVSLEKYRNVFGNLFINIVKVGESSGVLSENLLYLSDELQKKKELNKKVISAMIYPVIILVATTGLVAMLTLFIFPKILPVFQSLGAQLPFATRVLITISDFLKVYGLYTLGGIIAFLGTFYGSIKIQSVRYIWHWCILRMPIVGALSRSVNMASFSRTLGILLRSGVKIVEALNITSETLGNIVYQRQLSVMANNIQKGEQISKYLAQHEFLFPSMLTNMVSVGENTGNLSETLIYLSEFYENEVNDATKNLSSVLEPLLILIMGGIVAFVAIAIITPIYGLTQHIK